MKQIRLNVTDVHLKALDAAGVILGHSSRSETMRWLALNAVKFAEDAATMSQIDQAKQKQEKP